MASCTPCKKTPASSFDDAGDEAKQPLSPRSLAECPRSGRTGSRTTKGHDPPMPTASLPIDLLLTWPSLAGLMRTGCPPGRAPSNSDCEEPTSTKKMRGATLVLERRNPLFVQHRLDRVPMLEPMADPWPSLIRVLSTGERLTSHLDPMPEAPGEPAVPARESADPSTCRSAVAPRCRGPPPRGDP